MKKALGYYVLIVALILIVAGFFIPKPKNTDQKQNIASGSSKTATSEAKSASSKAEVEGNSNSAVEDEIIVKRVVDGDTIELSNGQKVRYIGIDTPESVDPRTSPQCFGKEASAKNKELVEGKKVRLVKDISETDRFGRLLRYVYLENTFINEVLVKEGFAKSSSYPPDIKYQEAFRAAEAFARTHNKGLWGSCGQTSSNTTVLAAHSNCPIKGNIASSGEKIFHLPGGSYYEKTVIDESKGERWFCSETEALSAGWRKSKV